MCLLTPHGACVQKSGRGIFTPLSYLHLDVHWAKAGVLEWLDVAVFPLESESAVMGSRNTRSMQGSCALVLVSWVSVDACRSERHFLSLCLTCCQFEDRLACVIVFSFDSERRSCGYWMLSFGRDNFSPRLNRVGWSGRSKVALAPGKIEAKLQCM